MTPISSAMAKASCWSCVTSRIAGVTLLLEDARGLLYDKRVAQVGVEVGERLVEQHMSSGRGRERARQRHALLLAAGELVRVLAALSLGQADE
jgi:hypothetical protein